MRDQIFNHSREERASAFTEFGLRQLLSPMHASLQTVGLTGVIVCILYMPTLNIHILIVGFIKTHASHVHSIQPELSTKSRHLASGTCRLFSAFASR
jgi:hypothetical protein